MLLYGGAVKRAAVGLFTLMGVVLTEDERNSSGKQCETNAMESQHFSLYPDAQW